MPQAVELFKIPQSPASEVTARRTSKPLESPAGSFRFNDVLSKATQRPSQEKQPRSDRDDAASNVHDDRQTQSASRERSKTQKTSKTQGRQRAQVDNAEATEPDVANATSRKADPQTAETPTGQAGDDSPVQGEAGSTDTNSAASEEHEDPTPDAQLAAMMQQPAQQPVQEFQAGDNLEDQKPQEGSEVDALEASGLSQPASKVTPSADQTIDPASADVTSAADSAKAASATAAKAAHPQGRLSVPRGDKSEIEEAENAISAHQSSQVKDPAAALPQANAFEQFASLFTDSEATDAESKPLEGKSNAATPDLARFAAPAHAGQTHEAKGSPAAPPLPQPELTPESRFVEDNHEKIVSGVRGELLPNGGTMRLRLDPPELGTMQVSLHMRNGVVSASFQTANSDAAQMLSHTLSDLRSTLEAHGIVVDKLHVQQSPRDEADSGGKQSDSQSRNQSYEQQQDARREQQRKDMIQKMWDRLAGLAPIDLVA